MFVFTMLFFSAGPRSICQASWPSPTTTLGRKGTSEWRRYVWWVEGFAPFILGACIAGWEWMCEWTSSECHFCAQTLDSRVTRSQPGELLKPCRLLWRLLERTLLPGDVLFFVEHICKCFVSTVLGLREGLRRWSSAEEQLPSFLAVAHQHCTGRGQLNEGFMFGEVRVLLFVLGVCMGGWEWMCEWMSLQCHSCAQTLDRGERCLGLTCNVRDNDIMRLHVSESPGAIGLLASEVQKTTKKKKRKEKNQSAPKEKQAPNALKTETNRNPTNKKLKETWPQNKKLQKDKEKKDTPQTK